MRCRMASSMSRATKMRIAALGRQSLVVGQNLRGQRRTTNDYLHQFPPHHIQRLLAGETADAFSISGKFAFHYFCSSLGSKRVENQSHRFRVASAGRPCDSGNTQAESCATAPPYSLGESLGNFGAHCTVFLDQFGGDVGERALQLVRIHDRAAEKVSRASTHGSNALG